MIYDDQLYISLQLVISMRPITLALLNKANGLVLVPNFGGSFLRLGISLLEMWAYNNYLILIVVSHMCDIWRLILMASLSLEGS